LTNGNSGREGSSPGDEKWGALNRGGPEVDALLVDVGRETVVDVLEKELDALAAAGGWAGSPSVPGAGGWRQGSTPISPGGPFYYIGIK